MAEWDLQESFDIALKLLLILLYVCNVLHVNLLPLEGVCPDIILVVYFVLLCNQIVTDKKYLIFLRLLLSNMGKCHYFLRLNLRNMFPVLLFCSFPVKAESCFLFAQFRGYYEKSWWLFEWQQCCDSPFSWASFPMFIMYFENWNRLLPTTTNKKATKKRNVGRII